MKSERDSSLDIFRGFTMVLMTIVNNPGDWGHVFSPLLHAEWHGATLTDMVFPFFVIIMCAALGLSDAKNISLTKIWSRGFRIFTLGLFLNFFSKIEIFNFDGIILMSLRLSISALVAYLLLANFSDKTKLQVALGLFVFMILLAYSGIKNYQDVRIPGVLQRLAIVYVATAYCYKYLNINWVYTLGILLLMGYWAAMVGIPIPDMSTGNLEKGNNLAAFLDNLLLSGHLWSVSKTWDPEGILSTIPAISSGIFGLAMGKLIKDKASDLWYLGLGLALIVLGKLWGMVFPINKALWTSSYVSFSAGWAFLALGIIRIMFKDKFIFKPVSSFLFIWGLNPILVFFLSGIIPRALNMLKWGPEEEGTISFIYKNGILPWFNSLELASFIGAMTFVLIWTIILLILKKKNLIFKV